MTSVALACVSAFFLLLHVVSTATAQTDPNDIAALKAIKAAIDPTTISNESCLASWNFTSDPCFPQDKHFICGMPCGFDNRIGGLYINGGGYAGTLTPLVSLLTGIYTIDLSNNRFHGPIPSSIFTLPKLLELNLRNNSFSGIIPPSISTSKIIRFLDLSSNSLSGPLPKLSSVSNLYNLDLSFNKFRGPIPKLPPDLAGLILNSNYLSGKLTQTLFNESSQLALIDLSANSLTGTIPGSLFLLPQLWQANLSNNKFTGIEVFRAVKSSLIFFYAEYNNIVGQLSKNFTTYPLLRWVSLKNNELKGPIPKEFSQTRTLKRLDLNGNYLNGKPSNDLFSANSSVQFGSFGDNCLSWCPKSSVLCSRSQKSAVVCRKAYGGK